MLRLSSYDWKFGLDLYIWLSANFKPRFGGEKSSFTLLALFLEVWSSFSSHKHVKHALRVLLILSLVPKTDVSWTASSEICL